MAYMTQTRLVYNHLLKYGTITSMEAFTLYGITRLAATIFMLKKSPWNLNIRTEIVESTNRYGRKVTHAKYHLIKEDEDGKGN